MILAGILLIATGYSFLTDNFESLLPFMMVVVAMLTSVSGMEDFKKSKKILGYIGIIISAFAWFVSIQLFFL